MIDNETVKRIALLSRLQVNDDKLTETAEGFSKILDWFEELKEVNTDDVEPLSSVNDNVLELREDVVMDGNIASDVLANAPAKEFNYFAVPKFIGSEE